MTGSPSKSTKSELKLSLRDVTCMSCSTMIFLSIKDDKGKLLEPAGLMKVHRAPKFLPTGRWKMFFLHFVVHSKSNCGISQLPLARQFDGHGESSARLAIHSLECLLESQRIETQWFPPARISIAQTYVRSWANARFKAPHLKGRSARNGT